MSEMRSVLQELGTRYETPPTGGRTPDLVVETLTYTQQTKDGPIDCPVCGDPSEMSYQRHMETRYPPQFTTIVERRFTRTDFIFEPCDHLVRMPHPNAEWH
jgi:hypothetical protein